LTPGGLETRQKLMTAREGRLRSLVADWQPEDPKVDAMIKRLCEELGQHDRAVAA
jgi:hypothetical protein